MEDIKIDNVQIQSQAPEITGNHINITPESIKIGNEWNSGNGIHPVIIPTTDRVELQNQYNAWISMPIKRRIISDSKCMEIFGATNMDIYNYCNTRFMIQNNNDARDIHDNNTEVDQVPIETEDIIKEASELIKLGDDLICEGTDSIKYIVFRNMLEQMSVDKRHSTLGKMLKSNYDSVAKFIDSHNESISPYPIFKNINMAPKMINESESDPNSFNSEYDAYLMGFASDSFIEYCQYDRSKYINHLKSEYENTKSLMEATLSDENDKLNNIVENFEFVGYDINNPKNDYVSDYFSTHKGVNIIDVSKMSCDYVNESATNSNIKPVYLIQIYSGKWYSDIVANFTKGKFSHACISIDNNFDKLFTFDPHGLAIESLELYKTTIPNSLITIHCIFVTNEDYKKIQNKLEDYLRNINSTKYAWGRLLMILLGKPGVSNNKLVCSQFVDLIFKSIDIDLSGKDSSLTSPNDFKTEDINIYKLYDGSLSNLNNKEIKSIKNKVNVLSDSVGCDYKTAKLSNSVIQDILMKETVDLSILRSYAAVLDNNSIYYLKHLKPYIETYVLDSRSLKPRENITFKYDGRDLKKLIEGN